MTNEVNLEELLAPLIHTIRGQRVMLSGDLARLYGVAPKTLLQAVKRNASRFPADFMFQLAGEEVALSRSQRVTLKRGQNIKYRPYAFTEQGVAMLSSVLRRAGAWIETTTSGDGNLKVYQTGCVD